MKKLSKAQLGNMTHGHCLNRKNSPTYMIWSGMIERCKNPNHFGYKWYGGKGIQVCERWKVFENFLKDMGERPRNKSLDRVDSSLGYNKENCRWVSRTIQALNKGKRKGCHSKFRGVSFSKNANKWIAYIGKNKKVHHLGIFAEESDAAMAYNLAAKKIYGQYAIYNDQEEILE